MIPLKVYLWAAIALALGGLLWHDKIGWDKLKKARVEVTALNATIETERANRKTEQDDRRRADESAKSLQAELDRITAARPVRLLCRPAIVSRHASEGGSSPSPTDSTGDSGSGEPLSDLGPAIEAVRVEAQRNNARHSELIKFEVERTH